MFITLAYFVDAVGQEELANIVSGRMGRDIDPFVLSDALATPDEEHSTVVSQAINRVTMAVNSAEKLVNAYLSSRYTQPLSQSEIDASPLPDMVVTLAKHDLMLNADEDSRIKYGKVLEQLKLIANGKLNLTINAEAASSKANIALGNSKSAFDFGAFSR